jgi:hypothetical protein
MSETQQTEVKETAEQFARLVRDHKLNTGNPHEEGEGQLALMRAVMKARYPNTDEEGVNKSLVFNTVTKEIDETRKKISNRLVNTGTIDMFGHPGFQVFERVNGKPWPGVPIIQHLKAAETASEQEDREYEEMELMRQRKKAKRDARRDNVRSIRTLVDAVRAAGYDPEEMTLAQAKAQFADLHTGSESRTGQAAGL